MANVTMIPCFQGRKSLTLIWSSNHDAVSKCLVRFMGRKPGWIPWTVAASDDVALASSVFQNESPVPRDPPI